MFRFEYFLKLLYKFVFRLPYIYKVEIVQKMDIMIHSKDEIVMLSFAYDLGCWWY